MKKYFDQLLITLSQAHLNNPSKIGSFLGGPQYNLDNLEQILGIKFLQWLHDELANGNIVLHKTPLVFVPFRVMCALAEPAECTVLARRGVTSWSNTSAIGEASLACTNSSHSCF